MEDSKIEKVKLPEHLAQCIKKNEQGHLLEQANKIEDVIEYNTFVNQLLQIDFHQMGKLFELTTRKNEKLHDIEPPKASLILRKNDLTLERSTKLTNEGYTMIAKGQVAILLLAAGQGSRLGFERPKGMYDIKMPSGKSLFQMYSEKIISLVNLVKTKCKEEVKDRNPLDLITFYVMTNDMCHSDIMEYFEKNKFFGLKADKVIFFQQPSIPALDLNGKVILESKTRVCLAPNGNGGLYEGLLRNKILDHFKENGIEYIHVIGVDNVLAKLADPLFLGFAKEKGSPITCKFAVKTDWSERVGVHVLRNGKPAVVEYSDMNEEQAKEKNENGELKYNNAGIVNKIYTRQFLEHLMSDKHSLEMLYFSYHVAFKKIKYFDVAKQQLMVPEKENGYKFEIFIFDSYPFAENFSLLEVNRGEEFAPVKNAPGSSSCAPEHAREQISNLHRSWLETLGLKFQGEGSCEVDSLLSYYGEGLEEKVASLKGQTINLPFYLK